MVDSAGEQPATLVVAGISARALEIEAIATRLGLPIEHGSDRLCLYCDEQGWSLS